jgi:uncharacterized membrane protein YjjP (DUF1212 family)
MGEHTLSDFMLQYGKHYVASGGPTSRLEEQLCKIGDKFQNPVEVFATPTGIFITEKDQTHLLRIKEGGINLGKLCWLEDLYQAILSSKTNLLEANLSVRGTEIDAPIYSQNEKILAAFFAGFASSISHYQNSIAAICSGLIALITWWCTTQFLSTRFNSSIFRDFMGCVITLFLAGMAQFFGHLPVEATALGGLLILVPGLSLTVAISEIADQNLVSGTAKLMQSLLTLLALGIAFLLFAEIGVRLGLKTLDVKAIEKPALLVALLSVTITINCFGILFSVPPKSLFGATLVGLIGWILLKVLEPSQGEISVLAPFCASLGVGAVSLLFGRWFSAPSQVFSVPGILVMLPGMLAFSSFRSFANGHQQAGIELGFQVAIAAGSIVFGLFSARIPFALRDKK